MGYPHCILNSPQAPPLHLLPLTCHPLCHPLSPNFLHSLSVIEVKKIEKSFFFISVPFCLLFISYHNRYNDEFCSDRNYPPWWYIWPLSFPFLFALNWIRRTSFSSRMSEYGHKLAGTCVCTTDFRAITACKPKPPSCTYHKWPTRFEESWPVDFSRFPLLYFCLTNWNLNFLIIFLFMGLKK